MNRRLARALIVLYAPPWQHRYADELEALLSELPCTPSLLADVVPRALATRKSAAALLAACFLLLSATGSQIARVAQPAQVASRADRRLPPLPPCVSYSSLARRGFVARRQCLD